LSQLRASGPPQKNDGASRRAEVRNPGKKLGDSRYSAMNGQWSAGCALGGAAIGQMLDGAIPLDVLAIMATAPSVNRQMNPNVSTVTAKAATITPMIDP
jgi:hypothetical protein